MPRSVLFILIFYLCLVDSEAQNSRYVLKGTVTDRDSKKAIGWANIIEIYSGSLLPPTRAWEEETPATEARR